MTSTDAQIEAAATKMAALCITPIWPDDWAALAKAALSAAAGVDAKSRLLLQRIEMSDLVERLRERYARTIEAYGDGDGDDLSLKAADEIERLRAELTKEREACARVADEIAKRHMWGGAKEVAAAIRARGNHEGEHYEP
jgi:uncharacterized protein with von Willebrand factor type A (vWA) domain